MPVIEVSHLPPAASFYAAITQPLGLQYLSASPGALHFGYVSDAGPVSIFTLQQSAVIPPPSSHITLLAPSPAAITSFYSKSLLANNAQKDHSLIEVEDEVRAKTRDLDGNMLEAVYSSRRRPPIETASTAKEARRVLEWQQEVARSVAASENHSPPRSIISGSTATYRDQRPPVTYRRADSYPAVESRPRLVRRETVTTEHYRRPDEGTKGFSGMKLVESPTRQPPPRRATYDHAPSHATYSPVVERIPARSHISRDVEQPPYVAQYTIAAPRRIEERSHVSENRSTRERSRSESRYERPLTILPRRDTASHVSHRSHASHRSDEKRSHHSRKDDESFVSARSRRTGDVNYIRASPPPSSKHSTTTIRMVPQEDRERRSLVSARHVPLPASRVGTYAASVAPSDSVSSVGTKRERERLRDRMRERY